MALQLADILSRNWWVLLLRGITAIAFGMLVLLRTRTLLNVLIVPFGTYALADGILGTGTAIGEHAGRAAWWVLFLWGLSGVAVGIYTFFSPPGSALHLMCHIAAWAIATGVLEAAVAVLLRRKLGGEWLLFLAGLISVVFGASVVAWSGAGAFVLSRLIAAYAVILGLLLGATAFRARVASLPAG